MAAKSVKDEYRTKFSSTDEAQMAETLTTNKMAAHLTTEELLKEITHHLNTGDYRPGKLTKLVNTKRTLERIIELKKIVVPGVKVSYTNKYNYTTEGVITRVTEKSVWINGFRNSWTTLLKYIVYA